MRGAQGQEFCDYESDPVELTSLAGNGKFESEGIRPKARTKQTRRRREGESHRMNLRGAGRSRFRRQGPGDPWDADNVKIRRNPDDRFQHKSGSPWLTRGRQVSFRRSHQCLSFIVEKCSEQAWFR